MQLVAKAGLTGEIERVSRGFRWYDVVLQPTYMIDNGNFVSQEGEKREYVFGINVTNERQMVLATNPRSAFIRTAK